MKYKQIDNIEDFCIYDVLEKLHRRKRLIYHGEADLQFETMEVIKQYYKDSIVRVEHPFKENSNRKYIDILVTDTENKTGIAIELKYKTKNRKNECINIGSEKYILGNHEAKNDNSYFILKDVEEIQNLVGTELNNYKIKILKGYVVFITNDKSYMNKEIEGQAKFFSLNKVNDNCKTREFKGTYSYYKKDGKTKKFDDLRLNKDKGQIGKWIELEKFADNEGKEHQLFQLVFEIERNGDDYYA